MWRELFFKNISTYIGLINQYLSEDVAPKPLSEYFKIVGGYAFKSKEYKTNGVPVIRISDFQNERIVLDNVRYYDESAELEKYELYEGDIIIAMTGGTIGKLAIVQEGLGKLYLNQRVGKFEIIDSSLFYEKYVYWIARGVEEKVKSLAWGGAQPNVSNKKIESMEFPIPSIDIQKKIVEFLSDFETENLREGFYFNKSIEDDIINIQNQCVKIKTLDSEIQTQKQLLSQLKQSILQEAIQGKLTEEWRKQNPDVEPASELLKRIKAEKAQLIKDKKIRKEKPLPPITEDEIPFELPEGWVWCRFGDIVSITSGDGLTSKQMIPGEIPVFGGNGINGYHNAFNTNEETVTIGRVGAYCGAVHLTPKFAWITDNCFRVYHDQSSINRDYLIWHLRYMNLGTASYDGSQPVISGRRVYPLLTFLPPFEEQKAIVEKVKTLMQKCQALEQEIKTSEANAEMLMQAVLKEAFESKKEEVYES